MSDGGRSSVDVLIDVIREQSTLARDIIARLEAVEKSLDQQTESDKATRAVLYKVQELLEAQEKDRLARAERENVALVAARAFFKSSAGQFIMLALAVWIAAQLGVLQYLLSGGKVGG